jgi:hypothetical protein
MEGVGLGMGGLGKWKGLDWLWEDWVKWKGWSRTGLHGRLGMGGLAYMRRVVWTR